MIRKLFVIIAVLALFAGTALAANLNDLQTAELAAESTGRTVVSDGSVLFRVWNVDGATSSSVGVSTPTTIMFYEIGGALVSGTRFGAGLSATTGIITSSATADTVGEVVDLINSDTSAKWKAAVGPDGCRSMSTINMLSANVSVPGVDKQNSSKVYNDSTQTETLSAGVEPLDNTVSRIKSVTHRFSGTGNITLRIYDGDNLIYRQDINRVNYNGSQFVTSNSAQVSPVTVDFASKTNGRGLASSRGKGIICQVSGTTGGTETTDKLGDNNISIVYDSVVK